MELKLLLAEPCIQAAQCSNRTFMELKCLFTGSANVFKLEF